MAPVRAAAIELKAAGEAALVNVTGLVDERFPGFGDVGAAKIVVLGVSGMTRMTSFGVRQWLKAMDALPKTITDLYLLGCPTFFVDQLNMVLNFGGAARVLTVIAPHSCPSCGVESGESIDVLAERANLAKGVLPEKECARCGGKLEFDETPESYFAFLSKYAATGIHPAAAQLLASLQLYTSTDTGAEKPPRIIKLVHGSVTYFRIIGTIGSMFRARPFLVGAEGEVVIDLAEVERFDSAGQREWRRLIKSLANQVPTTTLVDVDESLLTHAGETLTLARNIAVASVLVPYRCVECGRASRDSTTLQGASWPLQLGARVCPTCGGAARSALPADRLLPLQKAITSPPAASAKVIAQRAEILSRALTDANVAQAGESATAAIAADDTILGKYKIVRRLSQGGMAEVFLAKQVGIGGFEKTVALKRIQRKLLETRHLAIELFLNEAKIAGRLTHPNIVQVLDVGEMGGALYLAMEYVHGKDLRRVMKKLQQARIAMPLGEACYVVREVAQALDHAYWSTDMSGKRLEVVHRDVSPHNIILGFDGAVKLLDFGVAMSAVTEHAEAMIVGKWLYMSPEATTNGQIDHRSDLFSLGVILYLLCSGQAPFVGTEPREIVKRIRASEYRPLQQLVMVPERLSLLVQRLLAPQPEDRPQRGMEVAAELADIARQHGIDSNGASIAYILKQLFATDGVPTATGDHQTSSIREIVRTGDDVGSLSTERAAGSLTPSAASVVSRLLSSPMDESQTFKPRSRQMASVSAAVPVAVPASLSASVTATTPSGPPRPNSDTMPIPSLADLPDMHGVREVPAARPASLRAAMPGPLPATPSPRAAAPGPLPATPLPHAGPLPISPTPTPLPHAGPLPIGRAPSHPSQAGYSAHGSHPGLSVHGQAGAPEPIRRRGGVTLLKLVLAALFVAVVAAAVAAYLLKIDPRELL
jgi:serine/threonine protein kinase